ncbi:MAG: hypothetical protein US40_C0013G0026 [Candidatus Roizmanbacteria bacterium GW2011_GWC2_37_13]|uniref:Uncharacterized protein n=1 Tax=Candidatus Roizmanbacteria bacterium GW2011_GWC2_37_13 TaxID=1618486 RepID=A0A0G0IKZ3_9BACT|nr:MAG: hypothetical protein US38_C0014G0028 [Candidatus Roizmanbacteria bacterium GW2011_GWC1_37_12]KKQ24894.1 MAG: hypothetical protein US40_C0013G0026 [Candidatus Roizmanbacteria bacterium GW2011_GWC2_37_13]
MNKLILSQDAVNELVMENRYEIDPKTKFISRCIDGRYTNDKDLPALAFPGADVGELALVFATSNSYGFDLDFPKSLKVFIDVVGGADNFRSHTDSHADPKIPAGGCGHFKQFNLDPKAYFLESSQIETIKKNLNIGKSITLQGEHLEGAVLLVKGSWGIYPQYQLETDNGKKLGEVFIYHQTLVDERHRELAKLLVKNKTVTFKNGEDEEWLYNAFSEMSENHLMETARRLAKGLPIYSVVFKDDGSFKVEQQGMV